MPSSGPITYAKNERVFCLDDGLLFEAKVLESKLSYESDKDSAPQYLVHYIGYKTEWDDWVPQDRLHKLSDENRELAKNLKKNANQPRQSHQPRQRAVPKATTTPSKRKAADFDLAPPRSSEENSLMPAAGQGQKRNRGTETENFGTSKKLRVAGSDLDSSSSSKGSFSPVPAVGQEKKRKRDAVEEVGDLPSSPIGESPILQSPEASPGLPGYPKVDRRNNSRANRSPLHFSWGSPEPPTKRLRPSFPKEVGSSVSRGGLKNLMRLRPEYKPTKKLRSARLHPAIKKDPRANEAKRLFYRDQDPAMVLMVAGVPLEGREAMFPPPPEPKSVGRASKEKKKKACDNPPVQEDEVHSRPSVRLDLSYDMMSMVVDDWESVTESLSLIPLPSAHPVSKILDTYFDEENSNLQPGSAELRSLEEFLGFFEGLFQGGIGLDLLHRSMEPEQLEEIEQKLWKHLGDGWEGRNAGDVYGAEHLARMLGKMPELIAEGANNDKILAILLQKEVTKLARWLSRNSARFFVSEYEAASMAFIEKACDNQAADSPTAGERGVSKRTKKKGVKCAACSGN